MKSKNKKSSGSGEDKLGFQLLHTVGDEQTSARGRSKTASNITSNGISVHRSRPKKPASKINSNKQEAGAEKNAAAETDNNQYQGFNQVYYLNTHQQPQPLQYPTGPQGIGAYVQDYGQQGYNNVLPIQGAGVPSGVPTGERYAPQPEEYGNLYNNQPQSQQQFEYTRFAPLPEGYQIQQPESTVASSNERDPQDKFAPIPEGYDFQQIPESSVKSNSERDPQDKFAPVPREELQNVNNKQNHKKRNSKMPTGPFQGVVPKSSGTQQTGQHRFRRVPTADERFVPAPDGYGQKDYWLENAEPSNDKESKILISACDRTPEQGPLFPPWVPSIPPKKAKARTQLRQTNQSPRRNIFKKLFK